ncbi:MAG: UDP-N-acetylmuramoyl-L-alanine--D-glutamate ligase [Lentisphaerae bacterium]|nr:UDP-N-acetylmuramoyl-L-alanine--D-glutamate ligase [Lentisphaerota bacterium]
MHDQRALVLGLGASGQAAAALLRREGADVTVIDGADTAGLQERRRRLEAEGVHVRLGCGDVPAGRFDVAVVSPGIPADGAWVRALEGGGVPVVAELELAARRCACPMLAVTGTNGKSTCVKLCGEALGLAGRRAVCAGNYGLPLSAAVAADTPPDWMVVEVSSFQLERVETFHPRVGVLLNVQPDHLDRHGSLAAYRALKARLFERMEAGDTRVVPESAGAPEGANGAGPECRTFGTGPAVRYRYVDGAVRGADAPVSLRGTVFDNPVWGLTAAAATAALTACGVQPDLVARACRDFTPLPHRMQRIAAVGGVSFIDDSKATNLAALRAALRMCPAGRTRLIAGGRLKEEGLEDLKEVLAKTVRTVYGIGESAARMQWAWESAVPFRVCGSLPAAVAAVWREAEPGETILLSPGCASFDQFRNYEERGEVFAACVKELKTGGAA